MRHTIPCPKCKTKGRVEAVENLLGEDVFIIRCKGCGSLSVCRDGIHWNIVVESNAEVKPK